MNDKGGKMSRHSPALELGHLNLDIRADQEAGTLGQLGDVHEVDQLPLDLGVEEVDLHRARLKPAGPLKKHMKILKALQGHCESLGRRVVVLAAHNEVVKGAS